MTTASRSGPGTEAAGRAGLGAELTERECELLTITLEVLHETGYDRLTVDQVVARAHASKATVYRRWPSKAELVVAAFTHGIRQVVKVPDTGSLRGDLMHLAELVAEQLRRHGAAIAGVLPEIRRSPKLRAVFEHEFVHERKALIHGLLNRAVLRGEISSQVISDDIWDVLPGYLIFRFMASGRPATAETLRALVDDVMLPSLSRNTTTRPDHST